MRPADRGIVVLAITSWLLAAGSTAAQDANEKTAKPAQKAAAARPDPARMKQLLRVWEQQSARLKTLDVEIQRTDKNPAWGDEEYQGRAILKSPNYAWLNFKKVAEDPKNEGKKLLVDHEQIRCTGTEVWQYRSDLMKIFIFPLEKKDQKRALEEGPLPFLFNMKAAEAEARYEMTLVSEPAGFFVISVVPKLKIDRESFSKAFLKLNAKTYLPDRIFLVSPDGKSTKDFVLSKVRPNAPVMEANFKGVVLPKPWKVERNSGPEADQNAANVAVPAPVPAPRGTPRRR
jgi:TIGR03009 family protein